MNTDLLNILVCPLCKGKLYINESSTMLVCRFDKLSYPIKNNIPVLIPDQAAAWKEEAS